MHPGWLSNAYLVADGTGGTAVFVDSGAPLEPLLDEVERESLTPTHLLLTHGHGDHTAGNEELTARFDIPVVQERVESGALAVDVLPTPGHSSDSVAFVVNEIVCFTGDTLFAGGIGRTDLEGGDTELELESIRTRLLTLDPETPVFPGHGPSTRIGVERQQNPWLQ